MRSTTKIQQPISQNQLQICRQRRGGRSGGKSLLRKIAGFTLVEMLISVALVVLMMTLFATIFQMATGAMATQKGLAENDQRVRLVLDRLRNDLNGLKNDNNDPSRPYRTFRNLVPFGPDESGLPNFNPTDRIGYFYISENDPANDGDDVLALTVQFPTTSLDQYYGKAALLLPNGSGSYGPNNPNPGAGYPPNGTISVPIPQGFGYWQNQPDFDDVTGTPNQVGNSPVAEVCYFLRNGTLYRRVMLVRSPNGVPQDGFPTDSNNPSSALNFSIYTNGVRDFWNDFDYSAFYDTLHLAAGGSPFHFHGTNTTTDSLDPTAAFANPLKLGNPAYRFGFDSSTTVSGGNTIPSLTYGQPREYVTTAAGATNFIGRFTHAETSDLRFGYPASIAATNPMTNGTSLYYDPTTGRTGTAANSLFNGPRAGEDILMTNVLKFDIKVWDPAASVGPDGQPGVAGVDDDLNGIVDDVGERGWPGSDDGDFRDLGHRGQFGFYASSATAAVNDYNPNTNSVQQIPGPTNTSVTSRVKLPASPAPISPPATRDIYSSFVNYAYPNSNYNYGTAAANSPPLSPFANRYDTWNPTLNLDNNFDNSNPMNPVPLSDAPPFRPFNFGNDGAPGKIGVDDDGNGFRDYIVDNAGNKYPDPREIGWPTSDDQPVALSAIQIKITFFDVTSQQVREVTLVQSLRYYP